MIYASFENSVSTKWFHLSAGGLCKIDIKYFLGSQNRWKISKGRKSGVVITLCRENQDRGGSDSQLDKTRRICVRVPADPSPAVSATITASDGKNAHWGNPRGGHCDSATYVISRSAATDGLVAWCSKLASAFRRRRRDSGGPQWRLESGLTIICLCPCVGS